MAELLGEIFGEIMRFPGKSSFGKKRVPTRALQKSRVCTVFHATTHTAECSVGLGSSSCAHTRDKFNLTLFSCCLLFLRRYWLVKASTTSFPFFFQTRMCALTLAFGDLQGKKLLSHRDTGLHQNRTFVLRFGIK